MKKYFGVALLALLGTGCMAHMMETYGNSVQLIAPGAGKKGRGGVIRYLNTGLSAWKQSRRADAEKQMRHFCGGAYIPTAEGPRSKFGAAMPIGDSVSFEVDQYTYLAFECK